MHVPHGIGLSFIDEITQHIDEEDLYKKFHYFWGRRRTWVQRNGGFGKDSKSLWLSNGSCSSGSISAFQEPSEYLTKPWGYKTLSTNLFVCSINQRCISKSSNSRDIETWHQSAEPNGHCSQSFSQVKLQWCQWCTTSTSNWWDMRVVSNWWDMRVVWFIVWSSVNLCLY